jgi:hypothetical protein
MKRSLATLALALLLTACATSKPAPQAEVDPATDPSIVGAVDEAAREGSIQGAEAAEAGHRAGVVAGVLAAVFGGPRRESIDDVFDRYRETRDAVEVTSAIVGTAKGATEGAKRGFQFDLQFAELHKLEGVEVFRPQPDEIDARFSSTVSRQTLEGIAAVFAGREERAIDIKAAGDVALDIRDELIELGVPASSISARRDDRLQDVDLRIRYRS